MSAKTRRFIIVGLTVLVCLMLIGGALAKLAKAQGVVDSFRRIGVSEYTQALGILELTFITLYLIPKTMKVGFLFLCCYLGGAIATHLSHHEDFFQPAIPLAIIWITAYLRDQSIFYSKTNRFINE